MATDPKKDQEIRDEQLDDASGGRIDGTIRGGGDEQQADGGTDPVRVKV